MKKPTFLTALCFCLSVCCEFVHVESKNASATVQTAKLTGFSPSLVPPVAAVSGNTTTPSLQISCKQFVCEGDGCSANVTGATTCLSSKCSLTKFDNGTNVQVTASCDPNCTEVLLDSDVRRYCCAIDNCNGDEYLLPIEGAQNNDATKFSIKTSVVWVFILAIVLSF